MPPLYFEFLAGLGRVDRHTYTGNTRLVSIFAYVAVLGVSHTTYCREMGDSKTSMRERVKGNVHMLGSG
jgi:hypothetical protein